MLKIETMEDLKEKELTFVTIVSNEIEKIEKELNMIPIEKAKDMIKIKNTLEINKLIKILGKHKIEKLFIEQATIEDIFLHYYK